MVDTQELYAPQEAADLIGIGIATLWRWIKRGKLIPLRLSGRIFIPQSEIQRLKAEKTSVPAEKDELVPLHHVFIRKSEIERLNKGAAEGAESK